MDYSYSTIFWIDVSYVYGYRICRKTFFRVVISNNIEISECKVPTLFIAEM